LAITLPLYIFIFTELAYKTRYSGDVDDCINFLGTDYWVRNLNRAEKFARRQWFYDDKIAGFVQGYDSISVATVLGAGHMVPYYKPPQAQGKIQRDSIGYCLQNRRELY
jgi:hypothetical protein